MVAIAMLFFDIVDGFPTVRYAFVRKIVKSRGMGKSRT
jgi:hypothetical protein